ncbi:MAG: hypothetical protein GF405_01135 [Candidatus Eisenbacteria bacterium]|nr:hypothetical protein [Candidatus Eisenbacteria bacterium]
MSRVLASILAGCLILAVASAAGAGIPDPDQSSIAASTGGLTTCPLGDGPAFQYVTVTALRSDSTPIQGIDSSNFFFSATGGSVTITAVDSQTDVNGRIRFEVVSDESITFGNSVTIDCSIYTIALSSSVDVDCNSFDIDGSGSVGLADLAFFAGDYGTSAGRSDFDWNGTVGLADLAFFATHYGH